MAIGAGVLAASAIVIDMRLGSEWAGSFTWIIASRADGARAILSTVAGSMITVAGVTFSMTLLTVSHASVQLGPRLLSNFLRDTGNQVTLGTFIATFLYCLLVLRTIQSGDPDSANRAEFVPNLAVFIGLVLAVVSVAVLIYFIHHIPTTIHASEVVSKVGKSLRAGLEQAFEGQSATSTDQAPVPDLRPASPLGLQGHPLPSSSTGYVQFVDEDSIVRVAAENDLIVRGVASAGRFVAKGDPLLRIVKGEASNIEKAADKLIGAISVGDRRTRDQDPLFPADQLAEVAGRALSPGVNDPFTAIECIDQLSAGTQHAASRPDPTPYRYDGDGALRLIVEPVTFTELIRRGFDQVRTFASGNRSAALRLMDALGKVGACATPPSRITELASVARALRTAAEQRLTRPDFAEVDRAYQATLKQLESPQ